MLVVGWSAVKYATRFIVKLREKHKSYKDFPYLCCRNHLKNKGIWQILS